MENTYHYQASSETPQLRDYSGGYVETQPGANRASAPGPQQWGPPPGLPQSDELGPRWTPTPAYYGYHGYGLNFASPPPEAAGFGGPQYGFDPTVPPPPLGCLPPGHMLATAPMNTHGSTGTFPQPPPRHLDYDSFCERPSPVSQDRGQRPEDEADVQRKQDTDWIRRFLHRAVNTRENLQTNHICVPDLREVLYGAARLVSALEGSCEKLNDEVENECVWTHSYLAALHMKQELQHKLNLLREGERLKHVKDKVTRLSKRRARRVRARKMLQMEGQQREEDMSQKEAAIDKWRMKKIHEVEEKKREQELKLAADSVLCEVRRKQSDVKRMQDIMRSLEKLRRLRKEAASRKGIVTEQEYDRVFSKQLEQLRGVMKRRTTVYSAEEKALMVMLEGEQEEERRREQERRVKKERERQLQKKLRVNSLLFGEDFPVTTVLLPFREYYTQAQHSLQALKQIRREWDVFVVAADHPDATTVPQSWVLPDPPSDQDWAFVLQTTDTDRHTF